MTSVWLPYVPGIVAKEVGRDGARVCIGRERRLSGAVLFADISGFTAMSEALGRTGRAGTEELSGIVNGCFATLIGIAQAHGGDVAKFGGDAMTVLFVPDGSRRVIACALEMQAAMAAFRGVETRAGAYDLALKIGVAGGRLFVTTVGSQQTQLEFVIAGGALQAAATAQGYGAPGEVVLHESIASDVGPGSVEPRAAGYVVLKGALPLQPALGPVAVDESPGAWDGELALFLHPRIRERLAAGFREFVAEHRAVTVLFVGFDGFDYDGDRTVAVRCSAIRAGPFGARPLRRITARDRCRR